MLGGFGGGGGGILSFFSRTFSEKWMVSIGCFGMGSGPL